MKRIILDCDLMRHPHSGLYYYCLNLGKYVRSLLANDRGTRMDFYVPPSAMGVFGPENVHIPEKKSFWNFLKPSIKNCDVWHAPFQSGRIVPDKKKYPNTKILLTIHDLNPLHEGKPLEEQQKSLAHTQSLIDRSDAIVCISEFCRQDVVKNCEVGRKPMHVIHNGIHHVQAPELNAGSYKPSRPFLFGMGYVNTKKNYHVLLPLLKDDSIELIVSGRLDEPDYITSMENEAQKLGVADRLKLTGPISEGEKGWYLKNCLAFVHPSLAEGFGAPVVEAMQLGKPLFLSKLTSLPEIGGNIAFYFESFDGEHMRDVFYRGMLRYENEKMSGKIIERASRFDWNNKAKEYLRVYQSLF